MPDPSAPSLAEVRDALRGLRTHTRFGPGMGVLVDARRVERPPTFDEAGRLAAAFADPQLVRGHRVALLVAGSTHLGVGEMLAIMTELAGGLARAFTDPGEAGRWLEERTASAP